MYFKLLAFAKPYSRFVPKYTVLAIFAVIFGLANFTLLIPLLNVIFDKVELTAVSKPEFSISLEYLKGIFNYYFSEIFTTHGKGKALQFVCVVIVVSVFFSNLFKYWSQRVLTSMRTYVIKNLRQAVYDKLVNLHVGYFHDQRKGNIMSSLSNDITEIESSIVSSIQVIFREPLMIAGFIILLFSMSVKLTLFSLIVLPISGFIISTLAKKLRKEAKTGQQLLGNILSIVDETIGGVRIVKAFNAQEYVKQKFDEQNSAYRSTLKSMWNKREMASPISEFLGVSVVVGILLYGGQLVLDNESELNASEFITYIVLFSQILVPAKAISSAVTNIQRGLAAGERLFTILESDIDIKSKPDAVHLTEFKHSIEYRNVSFAYGDTVVLKNINLTIRKGETVALVGQSGAGKSTLADLLPRFYDVQSGQILIDGIDVRDVELNSLTRLMGIVTQEAILFNDTVFNNIAFGQPSSNESAVTHAAKIANAHEFIVNMENGYHSNIGDRGMKLSGGQRQRLSIARAVYKNPPVLILDEATSALDTESERLVQEAIQKLMHHRTSIVIAHRLSTIQHADQIIVMQNGEIVERGKHQELIAMNGVYRKLTEMQTFT